MKLIKLWEKIGKQPLKISQSQDVSVFVRTSDGREIEYLVTGIKYKSGKFLGLETTQIGCGTCEFQDGETPHTCDICTSLDSDDYEMWSFKK